jgi:hypothetical protein
MAIDLTASVRKLSAEGSRGSKVPGAASPWRMHVSTGGNYFRETRKSEGIYRSASLDVSDDAHIVVRSAG